MKDIQLNWQSILEAMTYPKYDEGLVRHANFEGPLGLNGHHIIRTSIIQIIGTLIIILVFPLKIVPYHKNSFFNAIYPMSMPFSLIKCT